MKLNCKPGQLARVINCELARRAKLVDLIVTVRHLGRNMHGEWAWTFDTAPIVRPCDCGCGRIRYYNALPDHILRPIKDPGDDAVDEMVAKVGKAPTMTGDWKTDKPKEAA